VPCRFKLEFRICRPSPGRYEEKVSEFRPVILVLKIIANELLKVE
jgi:hypothetical protein